MLCFGGTKNGSHGGEAVVFFNRELAREFDYRCKQSGQLCSKMRFLAAPWVGMLESGAWLANAAARERDGRAARPVTPRAAGSEAPVSAPGERRVRGSPLDVIEPLRASGWLFYTFIGSGGCRLMCAWDTTEDDVDRFVADLARLLAGERRAAPPEPSTGRKP